MYGLPHKSMGEFGLEQKNTFTTKNHYDGHIQKPEIILEQIIWNQKNY